MFAVRDSQIAAQLLSPDGFSFVPSPRSAHSPRRSRSLLNYADILYACGYCDPDTLHELVEAWRNIYSREKPDVVVCDYAPTAHLAAKTEGVPTIFVGSGFEIPPLISPFPSLRSDTDVTDSDLKIADDTVLRTVNDVLGIYRHPPLKRLADLFADSQVVLTTFRELDHYDNRNAALYVGPVFAMSKTLPARWLGNGPPLRILCYLRPSTSGLATLLQALRKLPAQTICSIPGASPLLRQRAQGRNLQIVPGPVDLEALLPTANLVIAYGSGTITAALLAGIPVLSLPQFTEQFLIGMRIEALGAGICLREQRALTDCDTVLNQILSEPSFRQRATAFADKYKDFHSPSVATQIADIVLSARRPSETSIV